MGNNKIGAFPLPTFSDGPAANTFGYPESKFLGVEIQLTNTTGKFSFPNDNYLNGKRIIGMWIQDNEDEDGVAPSGRPLIDNAAINGGFLTIRKDSDAKGELIPLQYLQQQENYDRSIRRMNIPGFNPGTTFVLFPNTSVYDTDQSVVILVEYTDC